MTKAETPSEQAARERRERIERSRRELAARYAADPAGVAAFNLRMSRIAQARKREEQRFEHLVLGHPRPTKEVTGPKRRGKRRPKKITVPVPLDPEIERAVQLRERWSHKVHGTPETHEAAGTHHDALNQLKANGTIDAEQKEAADEIANVYRSIEADVGIKVASLEARVDSSPRRAAMVAEGVYRVRMHLAYRYWRYALPAPKQLVLDMIVGDPIGYTVAARRYRVHNRKAKRLLIEALDRWQLCVDQAFDIVDDGVIRRLNEAMDPGCEPDWTAQPNLSRPVPIVAVPPLPADGEPPAAQVAEPLPAIDPEFLDEKGHVLPLTDIAEILRLRAGVEA